MKYWKRLPAHMRRGLFRLYLSIGVPWVLYFLYRLDYDQSGYGHRYRVGSDLFLLVLFPVGAVLFFYIVNWVIEGFGRQTSDGASAVRSSNDREVHRPNTPLSPEVRALFERLRELFQNEEAQVERLQEPFRSKVLAGLSCDVIPGATGEFGRSFRNPIPVNGPLGEMIYLSNLRATESGQPIMFHRLGSVENIDVFELVSFDGKAWDLMFLDLYHPRKSCKAPSGYTIATGRELSYALYGTNESVEPFPAMLTEAIARTYARFVGGRMRPREVREAIERGVFERPVAHSRRRESVFKAVQEKPSEKASESLADQGRMLSRILLDPDECWKDACKLREYDAPGPVATCEVAFARAAVLKEAVERVYSGAERDEIKSGVDQYIGETFSREEATKEMLDHYDGEPLAVVAVRAVRLYEENAFPLAKLADVLAERLSVPGVPSIEIAPLFEEVSAEAVRLLKFCQSSRKTAASLKTSTCPSGGRRP